MAVINRSVKINAPVGRVFKVVTEPENWTRYVTSLSAVKDLSRNAPAKGSTFSWEYKMMGIKFTGKGEVTENEGNKRFGMILRGKANIDEGYDFINNGDGTTTLKIRIEHDMNSELLNKVMDNALIRKLNNIESGNVLRKIKAMCEA